MTEDGCVECAENTYSGDGASSCTACPAGKISSAGSTSRDDCSYGEFLDIYLFTYLRRDVSN